MKRLIAAILVIGFLSAIAHAEMVHYWAFDEGEGTTVYDSISGNNGTLREGVSWTEGRYGSALSFDGSDDYVSLSFSVVLSTEWTFSAWLKTSYEGGTADNIVIGGPGTYYNYLDVRHDTDDVEFETSYNNDSAVLFSGVVNSSIGEWAHYTITRSGNILSGYKNGILAGDDTLPIGYHNIITMIGKGKKGTYWGLMDDVRIYNHALSQEEIQEMMPEPATLLLLGLGGLFLHRRK